MAIPFYFLCLSLFMLFNKVFIFQETGQETISITNIPEQVCTLEPMYSY